MAPRSRLYHGARVLVPSECNRPQGHTSLNKKVQMNKSQLEARTRANTEFGLAIRREIKDWQAKGYSYSVACKKVEGKIDAWTNEQKALDNERSVVEATNKMGGMESGSLGNYANSFPLPNKRLKGREACPLAFRESDFRAVHKAMESGQNITIKGTGGIFGDNVETKAFSTVDPLLPPELFPSIIAKIHEHRLLDHLPVIGMSAPSIEFLVHSSSSGGPPAITSEGSLKPDITLNFTSSTVAAQKIAATFGLSWETTLDFPNVISYAQGEVMKQIIDVENNALIAGTSGIVGFQQTSGILTLAYTTGAYLDVFSQGIENLRTGSSLAVANLIVIHPGTFGAVKRQKDSQNRYLLAPDPQDGQVSDIWGVQVLQTTACPAGTALLLDTRAQRLMFLWKRLNLAVERPSAVLNITGLPTS